MHTIRTFGFLLCAALLGCAAPDRPSDESNSLVGCWSGEDYQPVFDRKAAWRMDRRSNGTFIIEFSAVERGRNLPIQTEEGKWAYSGRKYVTITKMVSGKEVDATDPQYRDEYEIKSLSDGVMVYYHPKTRLTFTSRKVACFKSDA